MTLEILGNTNGAHYVQGTHDVQDSTMMVDKVGITNLVRVLFIVYDRGNSMDWTPITSGHRLCAIDGAELKITKSCVKSTENRT